MNLTEKQKWMVLSGLVPLLTVTVVIRMHHRPHGRGQAMPDAASENGAVPASDAAMAADVAGSTASAVKLAQALVERPSLEAVLPARDLFAPGSGDRARGGARIVREETAARGEPAERRDELAGRGEDWPVAPGANETAPAEDGGETARIQPPTPGPLSLTATFRDGAVRMAVLGGRLVKEGERVRGGYVLSRVEESRVTLTRGNDVLVVDMPSR